MDLRHGRRPRPFPGTYYLSLPTAPGNAYDMLIGYSHQAQPMALVGGGFDPYRAGPCSTKRKRADA